MISKFRNFFQSKIGLPIFIGFLVVVALAFAAGDLSGSATFGGLGGDDKVVVIDGEGVSSNDLQSTVNTGLDRARGQNPTLTMPDFIEAGGFETELDLMIDRKATAAFARYYGLRAGSNLINSEIRQIPAFQSLTGEFDQATYQNALRREGITDRILREDIGEGLLNQQVLRPAFAAPQLPLGAARQYAALVLERRKGSVALIPSRVFAPSEDPTDEQLAAFYAEQNEQFVLPERRTIRVVSFGAENIGSDIEPSAEQIAERFERDAEIYGEQERRAVTTFVVPTQDAAQALIERIRGGVALQTAARDAGFNVQIGEPRDRATIATAGGEALAEATFAAEEGELLTPVRSQLGWYVAQLDTIERTPARTLDQVSDQIADQLRVELRGQLLMELSENIEREVDGGTSLVDVANANGFEVLSIPGVTEDGMIFGGLQSIAPELRPIIATAFQMDESEPQLAVLPSGNEFVVFDVSDIVDSAAPPIDEVRSQVVAAWRRSEGAKLAKDAADRIQVAVEEGSTLRDAAIAENPQLAQVETIDISREELLSTAQGRVPSALVLMFSMAQGSTKVLEEQSDLGWFVVNLDTIEVPEIEDGNPALLNTQAQLSAALPGEYNAQLATAIRNEMGVERNEDAITAVRQALAGNN